MDFDARAQAAWRPAAGRIRPSCRRERTTSRARGGTPDLLSTRNPRMAQLSDFPITKKWPPQHPDRIQLYGLPTPNGVKVSILLEEAELPYDAHLVSFETQDQLTPEFKSLNPYGKIPAIIDPQ